jgi:hypothetical protein
MRLPQVLVYETDGRLAALLRPLAEPRGWSLREPRRPESCLRLLGRGGPAVFVLKLGSVPRREATLLGQGQGEEAVVEGRALVNELSLLERVTRLCPEAATVVVADADHAELAALAWDLGAAYVLAPPLPRDGLPDIVSGLLGRAAGRPDRPPGGPTSDD